MLDLFGNLVTTKNKCSVNVENDYLRVATPYNASFVTRIKTLPVGERKFDGATKAWLVAARHYATVRDWIMQLYNEDIGPMAVVTTAPKVEIRVLDVLYLGQCKPRGVDFDEAYGMSKDGNWDFAFPEPALREWFEGFYDKQTSATTYYGLLGVPRDVDPDGLKNAYRRAARQWHPDVCKEPNANEIFMQIQNAFNILSNQKTRARYDAGLALEATLRNPNIDICGASGGYRPLLRCGYVLAEGRPTLGRFTVSKILKWEDIINPAGQVLVVSWPMGADKPLEKWL